jgi:hypothetical protein
MNSLLLPNLPAARALLTGLALALPAVFCQARAVAIGGFQISAAGEQTLNLQTGQTELPSGGTATDSEHGLTLKGKTLSYLAGKSLNVTGAVIKIQGGGTLSADAVAYDVPSGVLRASGHLKYSSAAIQGLQADSINLYTGSGVVVASGGVKAFTPSLSASKVIALNGGQQVLLSGPYNVDVKGSSYINSNAAARLLLSGTGGKASATTRPTATALKAFVPYMK